MTPYKDTKVVLKYENIPPYVNHWIIEEYPTGKYFQSFTSKKEALSAIDTFQLKLIKIIEH